MRKVILLLIFIIIGIGLLVSIAFSFGLESRTYFWRISDSGFIIFLGITLLLGYYMVVSFLDAKNLRAVLLMVPLVLLSTCTIMTTGMYPIYYDCAIYSSRDKKEKIIIQYYETGLTGNSRKRLVKVRDEKQVIRPYILLENRWLPDNLSFSSSDWKKLVTEVLVVGNKTYTLESVNSIYE